MDHNPMNDMPGVPPPPAEVKVRTMRSDLESMAKNGGGLPQFQTVTVAGLAVEHGVSAATTVAPAVSSSAAQSQIGGAVTPTSSGSPRNLIGIVLVIAVAIIAIAVVGYFAYSYLGNSSASSPSTTATGTQ